MSILVIATSVILLVFGVALVSLYAEHTRVMDRLEELEKEVSDKRRYDIDAHCQVAKVMYNNLQTRVDLKKEIQHTKASIMDIVQDKKELEKVQKEFDEKIRHELALKIIREEDE